MDTIFDLNHSIYTKKNESRCRHCLDLLDSESNFEYDGAYFCCGGCLQVYQILNVSGLSQYYQLLGDNKRNPVKSNLDFSHLDSQKDLYLKENILRCYIYDLDCLACVWILEKLPDLNESIADATVNFLDSILTIHICNEGTLSEILKTISKLGYEPRPLLINQDSKEIENQNSKKQLIRIGVVAALTGNTMLFSVANYLGASGGYEKLFDWLSLTLTLPVITYGALPFYRNVLNDLKGKRFSIDFPIALSLMTGWILSVLNVFSLNKDDVYFDTLSILVFLILTSRYILKSFQKKLMRKMNIFGDNSQFVLRRKDSIDSWSAVDLIEKGDVLVFKKKEVLCFDGVLKEKSAIVDESYLTGEALPISKNRGDFLSAGTVCLSNEVVIEVENTFEKSYLKNLEAKVKSSWSEKSEFTSKFDFAARILTFFVIASCFYILIYTDLTLDLKLKRILAVAIITCPCALGLAPSLVSFLGLSTSFKNGIIVRHPSIFERILKVKNIFLDKTGTLTSGKMSVKEVDGRITDYFASILYQMEKRSVHPIAKAINRFLEESFKIDRDLDFKSKESTGIGMFGFVDNAVFEVRASHKKNKNKLTKVGYYRNSVQLCSFSIEDSIRDRSKEVVEYFQRKKSKIFMISGDGEEVCRNTSKILGLNDYYYRISPDQKADTLSRFNSTLMVGDGLNDSLALSRANVSIAMNPEMNIPVEASDILIPSKDIGKVKDLRVIAGNLKLVTYRNLIFTFIYNFLGIYLAFQGKVDPLLAAILMPISSLVVFFSSFYGTRAIRKLRRA